MFLQNSGSTVFSIKLYMFILDEYKNEKLYVKLWVFGMYL